MGAVLAADCRWRDRLSPLLSDLGASIYNCYLTLRLEKFMLRFELTCVD